MAQYDETGLGLKLPHPTNPAREDAQRVREALQAASTFIAALQGSLEGIEDDIAAAVAAAVNGLVAGAPGALDTLNELAAALGDDENFATTVMAAIAGKAPTVHDHDSRYYTESEIDAFLLPISSGWLQIGSTVTISSPVASVDFTSGMTGYRALLLEIAGLQHNSGSDQFLQTALSQNAGSSWGTAQTISTIHSNALANSGSLLIAGRDRDFSVWSGNLKASYTELTGIGATSTAPSSHRHTGGFNGVRLNYSGGSVSAGTIKLFGR